MLTSFVSFVLSRQGFYNETILDLYPWDVKDRTTYTTEFEEEDWVKHVSASSCWEEFREVSSEAEYEMIEKHSSDWTVKYSSADGKKLAVAFLSGIAEWYFVKLRDVGRTFEWHDTFLSRVDKSVMNYIVVHPLTYEQAPVRFKELDSYLKEKLGHQSIFSVEGFLHKFVPDNIKKAMIKSDWISVRDGILGEVRKEWPILALAKHSKSMSEIVKYLSDADLKYRLGQVHFRGAISDSWIACEQLLNVLYDIYKPKRSGEKFGHDLLYHLKETIIEIFGKNIYNDLEFIVSLRNPAVHAPPVEPDELTTFQVVSRAQLFHDLFSRWVNKININ